ncbi:MAG: hypothetical protein QOH10_2835 [Actinomycetota bacterium]|nr:hypothetical protein [Actinomycetota bacterium]
MLDDLVGDGFATTRSLAELSEAALYEVAVNAAVEVSSEKWSACPGRAFPWERRASAADVERLAHAVPASEAARWWSDPVTARPQVWLGRATSVPTAGVLARHVAGKPPTEIWTSSAVIGHPSAWWPVLRNGADGSPPDSPQSIWQLTPHRDARVFEIRRPADWRRLCEVYPGPIVDGYVVPDWEAAAEDFEGVHLTVEGLIRVQGVLIGTDRGHAMLDNWDAESTAWLRWSIESRERIGSVGVPADENENVRRDRAFPRARRRS